MENGTTLYWRREILPQEKSGLCRETITRAETRAVGKLPRRNAFAPFELCRIQLQTRSFPADHVNVSWGKEDFARSKLGRRC